MQRSRIRETRSDTVGQRRVTSAGHTCVLRNSDVVRALRKVDPEPIASHFVVVGSRRFPPKQVISEVTGIDRADFTTHHARRTLMRLGFPVGRRGRSIAKTARRDETTDGLAERLRPLSGQWVAIKDEEVIHAADSPQALVAWLSRHGQRADSVFRVPEDDVAASGLAPL